MSPPAVPGVPERFQVGDRIDTLERRMTAVEGHIVELLDDVKKIREATDRFAGYEATAKQWIGRGILLVMGSVGSTYGITRATTPAPTQDRTVVTKSATTVKVEACTAMQPGPDRDQCAIRILTELMGPERH